MRCFHSMQEDWLGREVNTPGRCVVPAMDGQEQHGAGKTVCGDPARVAVTGLAGLNKYSCSRIAFPELLGSTILFLFEYPVEVGDVVKPTVVRYFGNGLRGIDEHA